MKKNMPLWGFALLFLILLSCTDDDGVIEVPEVPSTPTQPINPNAEVNDFIWSGMNDIYLWQGNVPVLADDKFNQEEYNAYIQASSTPEEFFDSLLYDKQNVDFFSFMTDDYVELENSFAGNTLSNGVDFGLIRYGNDDDVLGYVRLILPNSDADGKNIKRGDVFTEVDGQQLTIENYRSLLYSENTTYTLAISELIENTITPTGESVELTKTDYTEPSLNKLNIIEEGGRRIGYIHYTQFTSQESELNAAFLELKNAGITDLVLDLRYNPGGYSTVSTSLASMITGQFKGEVIKKEIWNNKYQAYWDSECPSCIVELFDDRTSGAFSNETINSLNLNSVHIIGTGDSASASESLISGLQPYIDVTLIGELTYGKYTGSFTLYDSEGFSREGANPDHTYAIQPIAYRFSNKIGDSPQGGIEPNIPLSEDIANMGIIGDSNEPLLRAAINDILGVSAKQTDSKNFKYERITDYRLEKKFATTMINTNPQVHEALKKMKSKK